MKTASSMLALIVILGLFVAACDSTENPVGVTSESSNVLSKNSPNPSGELTTLFSGETVGLYAGKTDLVGWVTAADDGSVLTLTYAIDPGLVDQFCFTETHAEVADGLSGIPQTQKFNPIPGNFTHNEKHECVTEVVVQFDIPETADDLLVIAAHAVVSDEPACALEGVLYGGARNVGGNAQPGALVEIDVVNGTTSVLFDTGKNQVTNSSYTDTSPNALAYDPVNDRHYYMAISDGTDPNQFSELFVWDALNGEQYTGFSDDTTMVGAGFYNGKYYLIKNKTASLWRVEVAFTGAGLVTGYDATRVCKDFNGAGDASVYRFGDLAIDPETGMLYASANKTGGSTGEFWSIDVGVAEGGDCEGAYTMIYRGGDDVGYAVGKQLSFGSNGVLYAHDAALGTFFEIDMSDGSLGSPIGPFVSQANYIFNDLSSGSICTPHYETAWGDGYEGAGFPGANWATYFEYSLGVDP